MGGTRRIACFQIGWGYCYRGRVGGLLCQCDGSRRDFDLALAAIACEMLHLLAVMIMRIVGHLPIDACWVLHEKPMDWTGGLKKEFPICIVDNTQPNKRVGNNLIIIRATL